jgi:thiosulfate/3-mercaptopyruvate sulfurtransferase
MPNDPFVDIDDLHSLGPLRYLDARDQSAFDAGHAPGAVRVPLDEWDAAAKAANIGFAGTVYWEKALGALGVGPTVTAVAYDGGGMTNAARVWFILQYYGLKAVILNGGWPVFASAAGLQQAAAASVGGFRAVPGSGRVGLVDRQTLRDQLDGRAHVFDTRTRPEFTGEDSRNRPRSGHLPGARHRRMRICSRMAWCVRPRFCARCWSGSGLARAIISSPIAKAAAEPPSAPRRRCGPDLTTCGSIT